MREGWEMQKLDDVCKVIAGQSPKSQFYNEDKIGLPFYQGKKEFQKKYIGEPTKWTSKITKEAFEDDIIMSVRAPVGPVNFATQKCCIGRGLAAIRSSKLIDKDYCFFYLQSKEDELIGNSGAVFNSINKTQIGNIQIPIPPLPEQKQIVAILDKAFAAIDQAQSNIEKNIENAKELFQSKLNEIFSQAARPSGGKGEGDAQSLSKGWEEKSLGEVCEIKPPKKLAKEKLKETDLVSFVPMKYLEVNQLYFKSEETKTLKKVYSGYVYFQDGDVVLAKITPCFENGKLGIAKDLKNGIGFGSSEYIVYRTKDILLPEFLYFFLNREPFRIKGKSLMSGAVGHRRIQPEFYENELIGYPSITEQKKICSEIIDLQDELNSVETHYHQKLANLEDLKKSILQKAFSGALTVSNHD
jgi:type I restriction enzyme S subunit